MAELKVSSTQRQMQEGPIQDDVKGVKARMLDMADSLECIKDLIHEADYKNFVHDLVPPMLEDRVEWIRTQAEELFRDLGVKEPQPDEIEKN